MTWPFKGEEEHYTKDKSTYDPRDPNRLNLHAAQLQQNVAYLNWPVGTLVTLEGPWENYAIFEVVDHLLVLSLQTTEIKLLYTEEGARTLYAQNGVEVETSRLREPNPLLVLALASI